MRNGSSNKLAKWAVVLAALLASPLAAKAAPGDHIRLDAGGIMTNGLEIVIDLESGQATKKSLPRAWSTQTEEPRWQETTRTLSADELRALKAAIRQSLDAGLRSKTCADEDAKYLARYGRPAPPRPPIADSIIELEVKLDGRMTNAPERDCTSAAFEALWTVLDRAASAP